MEASVRLQNELKSFQKQRPFGFYARPSPNNILSWKCQICHGGYFFSLTMTFSQNYPVSPPNIKFDQKVFHPNVYPDNTVCLDILSMRWSPSFTIKEVLCGLKQLFDAPNVLSPANGTAAALLESDPKEYEKRVKATNERHHRLYRQAY